MTLDIDRWLDQAVADGRLDPVDRAFARFLRTLDPDTDARVLAAAACVSHEVAEGHICMPVDVLGERDATLSDVDAVLRSTPLVQPPEGDPAAPLVLDAGLLYLRRFWRHEHRVAEIIRERLQAPVSTRAFDVQLRQLFPEGTQGVDWQRVACAVAARSRFAVITGGPGTGKTTTVVRLLGLLQTQALAEGRPRLRIRLAAPTGKAAARLNASIASQIAQLPVDDSVKQAIPAEVTTLHRLLGSRAGTRAFRHDAENPLHLDVLVIDEASMIDLEMMAATLDALPSHARLVLLGDKDQLSSVEAGAVLGDLCARADAGHYDTRTREWLQQVSGDDVAAWTTPGDAAALDQHVVMLRQSRRFGSDSGIGALAASIKAGDAAAALHVLRTFADTQHRAASAAAIATLAIEGRDGAAGYRHYFDALDALRPMPGADDDAFAAWGRHALEAYGAFQLLCATRAGDHGVDAQNQRIEEGLLERGLIARPVAGWYEGRPVIVTRNDYTLGLMNGDVGVTLWVPDGHGGMALRVAFSVLDEQGRQRVRFVVPSRLSAVDTVYAMTVHKSQGSEFGHTALALPPESSLVLTRELVYTGVTRARQHFTLLAPADIFVEAIGRRTRRASGLLRRLV